MRELGLEREDRTHVRGEDIAGMWRAGDARASDSFATRSTMSGTSTACLRSPCRSSSTRSQIVPMSLQTSTTAGMGTKIDHLMIRAYLDAGHSVPRPEPSGRSPAPYGTGADRGLWPDREGRCREPVSVDHAPERCHLEPRCAAGLPAPAQRPDHTPDRGQAKRRHHHWRRTCAVGRFAGHLQDPDQFVLRLSRVRTGPVQRFRRRRVHHHRRATADPDRGGRTP